MTKRILFVLLATSVLPLRAQAQTAADTAAVTATALNYVEGWYEGSAERMTTALHPDLAKRIVRTGADGVSRLEHMSADQLISGAGRGGGKNTPKERQIKKVAVLDLHGDVAIVRAEMGGWFDWMELAKWNGEWKIVNVLWQMKPPSKN
ncbi:MAG: nuclear transport factor 2 family protein [Longimicrobiales bacterium]